MTYTCKTVGDTADMKEPNSIRVTISLMSKKLLLCLLKLLSNSGMYIRTFIFICVIFLAVMTFSCYPFIEYGKILKLLNIKILM